MSAGPDARVLRTMGRAAVAGTLAVLALEEPAAAHQVGNGAMPAPPWLLAYLGAFAVLATALVLRSAWPRARFAGPWSEEEATAGASSAAVRPIPPPPPVGVGNVVGIGLLALVILAAVVGPDTGAANIAPVAVLVVWWVGLPLAALVAGDVMRAMNPFVGVVRLLERARRAAPARADAAPTWVPAAFLFAFVWFFVAYHRPGSPRALAAFLGLYCLAAVGAGLRWGTRWLATGEGFGALSAAVSTVAPIRRSPAPAGTAALMVVWLGSVVFDAFASTPFWEDVVVGATGWDRTLRSTAGLVWLTAVVAGLYLGALVVADRWAARRPGEARLGVLDLRARMGVALVPVALAWFVAHDLTLLLFEGQNFVALLSDPVGRGWDLVGTISQTVDYGLPQAGWVPWVQVTAVVGGHVAALVVAHDAALGLRRRSVAAVITAGLALSLAVSVAAAALLVLR
ncbi:MAG: hypothetical protein ACLGI8_14095 [Acidimicrobiia bacterium]